MGQERTYVCSKCGANIELIEGSGMMWHSFDKNMFYPPKKDCFGLNFYDSLDKKTLGEVHKFIDKEEFVHVVDAYYQPYVCKKCGKIESKIYFRIDGANETYRPKYIC